MSAAQVGVVFAPIGDEVEQEVASRPSINMKGNVADPFADAQAWYDRAQEHIAAYTDLAYGDDEPLWAIRTVERDGDFIYSLTFNRDLLPRLKPIACEIANALFQSLDNIVAAAARQAEVERTPQVSWPWAVMPEPDPASKGVMRPAIGQRLKTLEARGLPEPWLNLIERTFEAHSGSLSHIDVVKEVSLSGKHWELVPTSATAHAIAWTPEGSNRQTIVEIPHGHFVANEEFVVHEGRRIDVPFQLVTGTQLVAADKALAPEPISAFEYASRFVATALEMARSM